MATKHSRASEPARTARSLASASISFGLVSIPVRVVSTSEPSHEVHFHFVHAGCGERVKQQYVCPKHGKVERDELGKGYEVRRGTMLELEPEELDALEAVGDGSIALSEFVPAAAVDPIFVERTYYLAPDRGGARPYRLLRDALEDAQLVGIARYAARGKAYVVMVRPFENGLAMHQLRYADEIKPWSAAGVEDLPKPTEAELKLAQQLVAQLRHGAFEAGAYRDEVKDRVRELLAEKARSGEAIVAPEAPERAPIPDLMAALRASLGGPRTNGEARAPAPRAREARSVSHARAPRRERAAPSRSRHGHARAASRRRSHAA
jgi:DNA end-binding protein Ku